MTSLSLLAQSAISTRVETQIELVRWTAGIGLVFGVALSLAGGYWVAWLYRHEGRGALGTAGRTMLIALRGAVLLLLGLIALEPVAARYLHRRTDATTIVLVDDSASMSVRDAYREPEERARLSRLGLVPSEDGLSRTAVARELVTRDDEAWMRRLAARNRAVLMRFSDATELLRLYPHATADANAQAVPSDSQPKPSGAASAATAPAGGLTARGPATDLGHALRDATRSLEGAPISGIVLISDGGMNHGEAIDAIARRARAERLSLFCIGVGDPAEPLNARVVEVSGPRNVFSRDPFRVTVEVAVDGGWNEPLELELLRRAPGERLDAARVVERRSIRPDSGGRLAPQSFDCRLDQAGSVVFTARLAALPHEAVADDNLRDISPAITVLDNKMRVLLVSGAPTYEYRAVAKLLERDETINVSCWLQSADARALRDGDIPIDHLPATREELLTYDAILLLDPDPDGFDPQWGGLAASFVEDAGGGLLFAADFKYSNDFLRSPRCRPIVSVLPIVPEPEAELILNQLGRFQRKATPILFPPEAWSSPILQQADNPSLNSEVWRRLDGVYWHLPVRREKPAATVLMRHGNPSMAGATGPHVLFATQFAGAGRTAFLGINSTWRWNRYGEQFFSRFWIQTLRFLMEGRLLGGSQRGMLSAERDRYDVGDSVVVTLRALNERFEPLVADSCELLVESGDESPRHVTMTPLVGREGFFSGRFIADRAGTLRLSARLPGAGAEGAITRELIVQQPDLELRRPAARRDLLMRLAETTGGRYFQADEADAVPEAIADCSESIMIRERPLPLWDNGYLFALIVVLLTAEWIGRKRARLL